VLKPLLLFVPSGDRARGTPSRKGTYVDEWGSVWYCGEDGVVGEVKEPAIADWHGADRGSPKFPLNLRIQLIDATH
jgi:hypothetical protein